MGLSNIEKCRKCEEYFRKGSSASRIYCNKCYNMLQMKISPREGVLAG